MRGRFVCVAALLCVGGAVAWAAQRRPTFKSTTAHVVVDAIVTDKAGRPVSDLTAADFEIVERGVPQAIADFEHVTVPAFHRDVDLKTPPGPSPASYSNAAPASDARAWVFMMVGVKVDTPAVLSKRMAAAFLQALGPRDVVAVSYFNHNDKGQDFTTDAGLIARAFDRMNRLGAPTNGNDFDDWFEAVLSSLDAAPQRRKAIVFVSQGFPLLDPARNPMQGAHPTGFLVLQQLERARKMNIPIYAIDPDGLQAPDLQFQGHMEDQVAGRIQAGEQRRVGATAGMRVIAERTNGRAFVNGWNIQNDARNLIADNDDYYLLGFYPEPYTADGRFHDIDVRVKRPGLIVRRREGYQAAAAADASKRLSPAETLNHWLEAAVPGGDLPVEAAITRIVRVKRAPARTRLSVTIAYSAALAARMTNVDHLDVKWIVINNDGKVRASGSRAIEVTSADNGRVSIAADVEFPSDGQVLRVAAVSTTTGAGGAVHVPLGAR